LGLSENSFKNLKPTNRIFGSFPFHALVAPPREKDKTIRDLSRDHMCYVRKRADSGGRFQFLFRRSFWRGFGAANDQPVKTFGKGQTPIQVRSHLLRAAWAS
jgi:hypothetical protein